MQEIATQIPTGKTPLFTTAGVSEPKTEGKNNRNTSACPEEGAHLPDITLYTIYYQDKKWVSSAVTPHPDKIRTSQEEGRGEQKSNDYKKGSKKNEKLPNSAPKYWN